MKKKFILLPLVLGLIYLVVGSNSGGAGIMSGVDGTGATNTGGCSCHTSSTATTVAIELDTAGGTPVTHYVAGGSYTIKITGTNTSTSSLPAFGFQVAAVKLTGAGTAAAVNAGTLATTGLPATCQNTAVGSINVVEQNNTIPVTTGTGTTGSTYVVSSIPWTAPVAGTGSVKLYGVINAVNNTGGTGGDKWNNNSVTITELSAPVSPITGTLTVCVGANTTLADATTGGTWTSGTTSVATVTSAGVVHGVSAGTSVISYNAGAAGIATATVTVNPLPVAGTIVGAAPICVGASVTLTDPTAVGTGTWSTTTPGRVTVNASGVVTGISAGSGNIVYTVTNSCGTVTTNATVVVNALPNAGVITGADSVCIGSNITLASSGTAGGTWTSGATTIATVGATTGVVGGVAIGATAISYTATTTSCGSATATKIIKVKGPTVAGTISGPVAVCAGATISLASTVSGGAWTSGNTSIATVVSATGVVGGVSGGIDTISYTVTGFCGSAVATYTVTGGTLPANSIPVGITNICTGHSTTFSDAVAGGTWTIANPAIATINPFGSDSTMVTGVSTGTTILSYTTTNSCGSNTLTSTITVNNPVTAGVISGPTTTCAGNSIAYTYTGSLGTGTSVRWYSSNTAVANVGLATGSGSTLAGGTTDISLAYTNACSADSIHVTLTVLPLADAGTITGAGTVCVGATTSLADTALSGIWSSGSPLVATVSATGVVTGVATGTAIISYTVTNSCGSVSAVHTVVVNTTPSAGSITGASSVCVNASVTLGATVGGGAWTSSATGVATVSATGVVTGVTAGSATITYTVSNACGSNFTVHSVTVNPLAVTGTISGAGSVCQGSSITLSETASGGVWISGVPGVASVNAASGVVTGLVAGTAIISYSVTNGCGTLAATHTVVVNPPTSGGTISGPGFVCIGATISLTDVPGGGTWTSGTPAVATIDAATGVVSGVSVGTSVITYTVVGTCGTGTATYTITSGVSPSAGTITGADTLCQGASISLVDGATGGVWSSSSTAIATVSATGVVTGTGGGTATITYLVTSTCSSASATHTVFVNPLPLVGTISGATTLCAGVHDTLSDTVAGGTWSCTPTTVATVNASGIVTGVSAGTAHISYSATNGCGTVSATHTMTINPQPALALLTGPHIICTGSAVTLSASITGGLWTATNAAASVNATGVVTGNAYGIDTIHYTITNICGSAIASYIDTVFPSGITGGIIGHDSICQGSVYHYSVSVPTGTWTVAHGHASVNPVTGNVLGLIPGVDSLTYTISNACGTSSVSIEITVLPAAGCVNGVSAVSENVPSVMVYPNPTDGMFTVEMDQFNNDAVISIMDMFGKVIEVRSVNMRNGNKANFDLSSLAAGSYIIRVNTGEQIFREKIVIW